MYSIKTILPIFACISIFLGCSKPIHSRKDTSSYWHKGDSISFTYSIEEIVDYPIGNHRPILDLANYKDISFQHIINGKIVENRKKTRILRNLSTDHIKSIQIIPASEALELYGKKAVNGAVVIETIP